MKNGGTWSKEHLKIGPGRVACGNRGAQLYTPHLCEVSCERCKASKYYAARQRMADKAASK
jgi:hypothetical protein